MAESKNQLVLSLSLEHCDTSTLLSCLFLDKHTHKQVMELLKPQFMFIHELKYMFDNDIYQGIKFVENRDNYDVDHSDEVLEFLIVNKNKYNYEDLFEIYVKLYPFSINTKAPYIKYIEWGGLYIFIDDFGPLIEKYYYKFTPDIICVLVRMACKAEQYVEYIEYIINKGFSVTKIIKIPGYGKTTILNYSICSKNYWLVQKMLNNKPDLFMYDCKGECAYTLLKQHRRKRQEYKNSHNYEMLYLLDTLDKLSFKQKLIISKSPIL